ncbi:hypothetical protein QL285_038214 [Trifolium repens]|nr:hypothetical protein QL285_038214 [Trifolium repens]
MARFFRLLQQFSILVLNLSCFLYYFRGTINLISRSGFGILALVASNFVILVKFIVLCLRSNAVTSVLTLGSLCGVFHTFFAASLFLGLQGSVQLFWMLLSALFLSC